MAFFAQGKAGFLSLEEGRRLPAVREREKWGFTGQRRSGVDSKQAWWEAEPHRVLRCLAVSLHFTGHGRGPGKILNKDML